MSCTTCGHDNPSGDRFCGGCGAPLERACATCQHENPPGHRFCGGCGAALESGDVPAGQARVAPAPQRVPRDYTPKHLADKILQSKFALEGERKQVTVMFADVKGSMELAEEPGARVYLAFIAETRAELAQTLGDADGAVHSLGEAQRLFSEMGALGHAERLEALLEGASN